MEFDFETDPESHEFCVTIASIMAERYAISIADAIDRINRLWAGTTFVGEDDIIYHQTESYWANHIYRFYEDRKRDGTADTPREVLIERRQKLWSRLKDRKTPEPPPDERGPIGDE